ncbi:hypothetical protein EPO05_04470 [Patescibacteria group bacterium]|nr:MAG: hypothetical protein EPO05_04470 [Patescibacteria group bacterium]
MRKTLLGLVAVGLLSVGGSALAFEPIKPIITIDPAIIANFSKNRCEKAVVKIGERLNKIEKYQESHMVAYQNLVDRLTALAERLKLKGYDVATLEADIVVLKEKIQSFSTQYDTCKVDVEELKDWDCATKHGDFKDQVKANRQCLKDVHLASKAVRSYYFSQIRPDIKAIRQQQAESN